MRAYLPIGVLLLAQATGLFPGASNRTELPVGCDSSTYVRGDGSCVVPSTAAGSVKLILTGTCGTGWSEITALNGKTLVGTLAANGDVGSTGGNDNITPAGTNGNSGSEAAHTHSVTAAGTNGNTGAEAAHTHAGGTITIGTFVNVASATTGNCAATNIAAGTGSTTACKGTAPNLTVSAQGHSGSLTNGTTGAGTSHLHSGPTFTGSGVTSAAGSSHLHSGSTFTGTQFDNRSAYTKVIFCVKD